MKKAKHSGQDPWLAVLDFRNTPSQGIGESPCQRLMNRRTKTLMPLKETLLKPRGTKDNIEKMKKEKDRQAGYYNRTAKDLQELQPGDIVRVKPTQARDKEWKKGTIVTKEGQRSYTVQTRDGTYRRNRSHLKNTPEEPNDFSVIPDYCVPSDQSVDQSRPTTPLPDSPRPCTEKTTARDQCVNNQPIIIPSRDKPLRLEGPRTTRSGRTVKPPQYLENYVQAVYYV